MSDAPAYSKNNPFMAKLTENRLLNKEGSKKETNHFIINIEGSGLSYTPGASIGIFAKNDAAVVDEFISKLGLNPDFEVAQKDGSTKSLRESLLNDFIMNRAGKKFIKAMPEKLQGDKAAEVQAIVDDKEKFDDYIWDRDYVDVLNDYPELKLTEEDVVGMLQKSAPRLYSIASSIEKHPHEVHLTVAIIRYETHGRKKRGYATGYLADDVELNTPEVPVFFTVNKHFKLPEDPNTDIIMVGPGTGIAPFRAFLEQRDVDGSKGRNWLFFGDQHAATDFLYEEEFEAYKEKGLLTRVDTAFSRDQAEKVYVQDRMAQAGEEIWNWLSNGAYFYVCGDASRMAKDVERTLIEIAQKYGNMSEEQASEFIVKKLGREERRYLKDVY